MYMHSRNENLVKFFSKHLIIYGVLYFFFSLQSNLNACNKLNVNWTFISRA